MFHYHVCIIVLAINVPIYKLITTCMRASSQKVFVHYLITLVKTCQLTKYSGK